MEPASRVSAQLIPLCTKGNAYTPENQALSQHFLFRGFSQKDPQEGIKEYEEALAWNVANENAKQLLGDAHKVIVMKQLDRAVECVEREDFSTAYDILEAVREQLSDDEAAQRQVSETLGFICFRHADTLAKDGQFVKALECAKEAEKLIPDQPVIKQLVKEMAEYAPEEDNIRHLKSARQAYERKQYDQTIRSASKLSSKSKFHGDACRLQSAAYFHRGIDSANQQHFDQAISDIEDALRLSDHPEDRKVISQQLDVLQQAQIANKVNQAFKNQNWREAEKILRGELKKSHSQKLKKQLESELAMTLNARAVGLLNATTETEKMFGEAINEIMNIVQQQSGVTRR